MCAGEERPRVRVPSEPHLRQAEGEGRHRLGQQTLRPRHSASGTESNMPSFGSRPHLGRRRPREVVGVALAAARNGQRAGERAARAPGDHGEREHVTARPRRVLLQCRVHVPEVGERVHGRGATQPVQVRLSGIPRALAVVQVRAHDDVERVASKLGRAACLRSWRACGAPVLFEVECAPAAMRKPEGFLRIACVALPHDAVVLVPMHRPRRERRAEAQEHLVYRGRGLPSHQRTRLVVRPYLTERGARSAVRLRQAGQGVEVHTECLCGRALIDFAAVT